MISKRLFVGPVVVLSALLIGYPAFWFFAATYSKNVMYEWIERQNQSGSKITVGKVETSGFPFVVRIELSDAEVTTLNPSFSLSNDGLSLEIRPWDLYKFRIEVPGTLLLRYALHSDGASITARSAGAAGIVQIDSSGELAALSLELKEIGIDGVNSGVFFRANNVLVDISQPTKPPISHTEPALNLSLAIDNLKLPTLSYSALGDTIESIRLKAQFLGPLRGHRIYRLLSDWRGIGGTLEMHWFNLIWGALDLRANGTIALDSKMRAIGALTADIRGYEETLEALAEAGLVKKDILPASRITLNLLAKRDVADGRQVLTVPITAQDGGLYLGPIKLLTLPILVTPNQLFFQQG